MPKCFICGKRITEWVAFDLDDELNKIMHLGECINQHLRIKAMNDEGASIKIKDIKSYKEDIVKKS